MVVEALLRDIPLTGTKVLVTDTDTEVDADVYLPLQAGIVTVIVALPSEIPLTTPDEDTVATPESDELHTGVTSLLVVQVRCMLSPTPTVEPPEMETVVVIGLTTTAHVAMADV